MVRGDSGMGTDGGGRPGTEGEDGASAEEPLESGLIARAMAQSRVYPTRAVRPWTRVLMRAGLWGAVVLGAVGGILGLFSLGSGSDAAEDQEEDTGPLSIPAGVGGMAELVVEEWLSATAADRGRVDPLFVEAPVLARDDAMDGRDVLRTRAVAGEVVDDGYWAVTVRVDLMEVDPEGGSGAGDDAGEDADPEGVTEDDPAEGGDGEESAVPELATWYVEVGIVGEEDGALAALRTPAVMPPPEPLAEGWTSRADDVREPGTDSDEVATLADFLRALLTGDGDPSRYTAPGVDLPAVDPPVFAELEVTYVGAVDVSDTMVRAQVHVDAVTVAGLPQQAAYEVVAEWREGRLEVLELWGAASLRGRPDVPSDEGDDGADGDDA